MNTKEAISSLYDYFNSELSVAVQVAGSESRPVPSVTIDEWELENETFHNSHYAGSKFEGNQESERVFRYYYSIRVDLTIRSDDNVEAHNIQSKVQQLITELDRSPETLHSDVRDVSLGRGGGINHQFNVPSEQMVTQSLHIDSFIESAESGTDVLEEILVDIIEINNT